MPIPLSSKNIIWFIQCIKQFIRNWGKQTWVWSLGWEDPLEEGMTTHSSILAERIPWTEEPGRLQSIESQRVRHDWSNLAHTHTHTQTHHQPSQVAIMVKNPPANAGDIRYVGSIPGSGRSPRGGNGKPLQYSCLENPMDRGSWQATGKMAIWVPRKFV